MRIGAFAAICVLLIPRGLCFGQALLNPGFEQVSPGADVPAEWAARSVTRHTHKTVTEARSGERAAQIQFADGSADVAGYYYSAPQPLPVCKSVTVSAWVRVKAKGQGAYLRLLFRKGDTYVGLHNSGAIDDSQGEWRKLELSAAPPPDADAWCMSVELNGVGTAVFDDAAVRIDPADIVPAARRDAAANVAMDLGAGRIGVLGPVATPTGAMMRIRTTLKGSSAVPPTIHVGSVWYSGDRQLGVMAVPHQAWQTETLVTHLGRPLAKADGVRPIAYADSKQVWDAAVVAPPVLEPVPPRTITPAAISPAPHPRLFVTPDRLARLRALTRQCLRDELPADLKDFAAQVRQLIATADKCFGEKEIVVYGARYKTTLPPAPPPRHKDGFPYWTGLSRAIEARVEALATAYLLTGDKRYADLARSWVLALCEWPAWTDPDYPSGRACLDTGHFCHAVAVAYDFVYDQLTEADRRTIRDALLEKGAEAVMKAGETGWARTMSWPNGFAVVMGGMGVAGMACLGDDDRAEPYVQYARRRLWEFIEARDRDGGYVEGLTYGGYAMSFTMPFAAAMALHGDDLLAGHPYVDKTLRFAAYCLDPNSATSVNFADAAYATRAYNSTAGWLAGKGLGLGRWYLRHNAGLAELWRYTPPLAILWHPLDAAEQAPADWDPAAHYRDIGWVIMRRGFEPDDFVFAMRSGYHGSHCQLDQNSFMLSAGGEWLLRDAGYGQTATNQHSTLLVAGQGQSPRGGRITGFGTVGRLSYAAGDASDCYPGLGRFVRHAAMVDGSYLVIIDEVAPADGEVAVASQLMTGVAEPLVDGRSIALAGKKRCTVLLGYEPRIELAGTKALRTVVCNYRLARPSLKPMLIVPGDREAPKIHHVASEAEAVHLRLDFGGRTDHIVLNVTGALKTVGDVTTDARLLWLRAEGGTAQEMSVVWGSKVRLGTKELLGKPLKGDFVLP